MAKETASSSSEPENNDELEQITIARALLNYRLKEKMAMASTLDSPIPFARKFPVQNTRPTSPQPPLATTSKILPLFCPKTASRHRPTSNGANEKPAQPQPYGSEGRVVRPQKFPAVGAAPYVPIRQYRTSCRGIAPPVTVRTTVPCFSAPPHPPPSALAPQMMRAPAVRIAPSVTVRQAVPVYAAPPVHRDDSLTVRKEDPPTTPAPAQKVDSRTVFPPAILKDLPTFTAAAIQKEDTPTVTPAIQKQDCLTVASPVVQKENPPIVVASAVQKGYPPNSTAPSPQEKLSQVEKRENTILNIEETEAACSLGQLKI